jgi:hypothetical protein
MQSDLEQVVDLLQQYVIRLEETKPVPMVPTPPPVLMPVLMPIVKDDSSINSSYLFHITRDKDKLFWAFYIMLNGEDAYKYLKTKFVTEKEIKIGSVEKMRKLPNVFKQHKLNKVPEMPRLHWKDFMGFVLFMIFPQYL